MTDAEFAQELKRRLEWRQTDRDWRLYCGPLQVSRRHRDLSPAEGAKIKNDIKYALDRWAAGEADSLHSALGVPAAVQYAR